MNIITLLAFLFLLSCSKKSDHGSDGPINSPKEGPLVDFPLSFADGRKMLFRSMTHLNPSSSVTEGYGTTGKDAVHYSTFVLNQNSLTVVDLKSGKTLYTFEVKALDDKTITVDFNTAFQDFEADDVERDSSGQPILNSSGFPNFIYKKYKAVPGSLKVLSQFLDGAVIVSQDLALQASASDQYSQASAVSRIDYSFSPAQPEPAFPILKITDSLAQAQFFSDDDSGLAERLNPGQALVLHMEEGTPASIKAGVQAGMTYWNKIFGKVIFSLAEDQKRAGNFYAQNIVRVVPTKIRGAGSISQNDLESSSLLLPGFELQFPQEFFNDLDVEVHSFEAAFVTAHELGHVLGLQHNFAPGCQSVMCNEPVSIFLGKSILEEKLQLNYDKQAIDYLYRSGKILPTPFAADSRN